MSMKKTVLFVIFTSFLLLPALNLFSIIALAGGGNFGGPSKPDIILFQLEDGENGNVCLSRYKAYSFNATVNDTDGAGDIKYVNITIEPQDENIIFCWSRDNITHFSEMAGTDPGDLIRLDSDDTNWDDLDGNTTFINFLLNFNWSYPDEDLSNVLVEVTDGNNNINSTLYHNLFQVENDLDTTGTLAVDGEHQGALLTGDWVRASEEIVFSNMTVIYEAFPTCSPDDQHFNVSVANDTGTNWYDASSSGQTFQITTYASAVSDNSNVHTVSVNKVPGGRPGNVPNSLPFTVKVDGEAPPPPENVTIHADSFLDTRIFADDDKVFFTTWNISVDLRSGTKGYYFSFINNEGNTDVHFTTDKQTLIGDPLLNEGNVPVYVWCEDNVGNIGLSSSDTILLDTTAPVTGGSTVAINGGAGFTGDTHLTFTWDNFVDQGALPSGIDFYYYSFDNNETTSDGIQDPASPGELFSAPEGTVNVYVWAVDRAGNKGLSATDDIMVDLTKPTHTQSPTFYLENGSKYTNDAYVHYNFTGIVDPGPAQSGIKGYYYAYSNNSGTSNGIFIDNNIGVIKITKTGWTNVYVWGVDWAGNIQDRVLRATILVDVNPPEPGTIQLQSGIYYYNSSNVQVRWSGYTDENDPISRGTAGYYFSTDNNEGTMTGSISNGGIRAHYYDGTNFNTFKGSRYESTINTGYPNGAPFGAGGNSFSVIWNGSVFCPYSETYTFKCGSDDGFRLYIDDIYRMGYWGGRAYAENSASMYLQRGFHRFKMHFYEGNGGQRVTAKWSSAHINEAIIAANYFWAGQTTDIITLPAEGVNTVYAWAQDHSFNIGDAVSDDIFIDLHAPSPSAAVIEVENNSGYCSDKTLYVNWSGFEDLAPASGIKGYYVSYGNGSGTNIGTWTNRTNITIGCPEGDLTVYVWAEDNAGNRGIAAHDAITVEYPKLVDNNINHEVNAFRGKANPITMNFTDRVYGEEGLTLLLQIRESGSTGPWDDLPVEYRTHNGTGYWYSWFTPDYDVPIATIFDLRLQYSNPGGYVSSWKLSAFMSVNNIPSINDTAVFTALEDHDIVVDFAHYGWDLEDSNASKPVEWSVREYNDEVIRKVSPGDTVNQFIFSPAVNFNGDALVLMRLTDSEGDYSERSFEFFWEGINDPPSVFKNALSTVYLEEDNETGYRIDLSVIFYDGDGDELTFGYNNATNVNISLSQSGMINVTTARDWSGIENVTFTATDGDRTVFHIITFIVEPVNDPPEIEDPIDTLHMFEDDTKDLDIEQYFSDPDDTELLFMASTDEKHVQLRMLEMITLRIIPDADWYGKTDITISAADPHGRKAEFNFELIVEGVNDIPEAFIEYRSREIEYGSTGMEISGRGVDKEGAVAEYRWQSSRDGYLGNTSVLNLFTVNNISLGKHIINFSVMDMDGAWSLPKAMEILVTAPSIEVLDVSIDSGKLVEGEKVRITVTIKNSGTSAARNTTVFFRVDGDLLERKEIFHILPGETKSVNATWETKKGKHNITIEVLDAENHPIAINEEIQLNSNIEVETDPGFLALILSLAFALIAIIGFFVISSYLRKRRRKKTLKKLRENIRKANKSGVGVLEVKNELEDLGSEFGIRLK